MNGLIAKSALTLFSFFGVFYLYFFQNNDSQSYSKIPQRIEQSNSTITTNQSQPIELGKVNWLRSFDTAKAQAISAQKPLLILFQEVPGCSTCTKYGNEVLSHPLIVEAIETFFTPLCIYNNKGGNDAATLKLFGEPSWNNPVVRIINPNNNKDITTRVNGNYTPAGLVDAMLAALQSEQLITPQWLSLLYQHLDSEENNTSSAMFSMYCFWSGEAKIGDLTGITATQAGYANGKEVVKVKYDDRIISPDDLNAQIKNLGYKIEEQSNGNFRPDGEPKYYLTHSDWKVLPMLPNQATLCNSALAKGEKPNSFLSPRQIDMKNKIINCNKKAEFTSMVDDNNFISNWYQIEEKIAKYK